MVESGDKRVVFENKQHDFPQRILYWLDAQGALHARIEGPQGGKTVSEEWVWKRAKQPSPPRYTRDMSYFRRRPSVRLAVAALAVYAALLVVGPVAHTDLADHVKSSSHCQVCAANPLAARVEPRVATAAPHLSALGEVAGFLVPGFVSPVPFRTSGRSPPA